MFGLNQKPIEFYKQIQKGNTMIKIIITLAITILISQAKNQWFRNRQAELLTHLQIGSVILKPNLTKIITFLRPESFQSQGMTLVLEDYAHALKSKGQTNISFYDVNCAEENKLCQQMGVTQVPFIFIFNPQGMAEQQYPGDIFTHEQTLIYIKETVAKIDRGQFMKANYRHYMRVQHLKQLEPQHAVQVINKADASPNNKIQNPAEAANNRPSRRTSESKKAMLQQIKPNQVKLETENKIEKEHTQKYQGLNTNKKDGIKDLFKQPGQVSSISGSQISMTQQAREKHQILLSNIQKSRENRRKYFIVGSGSIVPILFVIGIILGVIYYIRGIITKSSPLRKVISGAKTLYVKVRQEEQSTMK